MTTPLKSEPIIFMGDINRYLITEEGNTCLINISMRVRGTSKEQLKLSVEQWDEATVTIKPGNNCGYNKNKVVK